MFVLVTGDSKAAVLLILKACKNKCRVMQSTSNIQSIVTIVMILLYTCHQLEAARAHTGDSVVVLCRR